MVIPIVTPLEMGAADARTIAAGTPEPILMERAGRAVAWRVRHVLGGTYGRRIVVLCGKGNNGGDGRIAAAALRAWGARVDVIEIGASHDGAVRSIARADAVIDAMYGTGFRGVLADGAADLVGAVGDAAAIVVAVDIPSGVDGLTGAVHGPAVSADHTVTFAAPKPGLWKRVKAYWGQSAIDRFVDAYITPEGLPKMFQWRKTYREAVGTADANAQTVPFRVRFARSTLGACTRHSQPTDGGAGMGRRRTKRSSVTA